MQLNYYMKLQIIENTKGTCRLACDLNLVSEYMYECCFKLKYITVFDHYCFNCSQEAIESMVHRLSSLEQLQVNMTWSYVYGSWECVDWLQNLQRLLFKVVCVMEIKCSMCFQEGVFWLSILLCYFNVTFVSFLVSSNLLGQTNKPLAKKCRSSVVFRKIFFRGFFFVCVLFVLFFWSFSPKKLLHWAVC